MRRIGFRYLSSGMLALVLFPLVLLQGCGSHAVRPADLTLSPLDPALENRIDSAVTQLMHDNQIPGLAIGIIQHQQVVYSKGFGIANIQTGATVTPATIFQMGSVSKIMLGISAMQLQTQGKIDLDAPVTTYLPDFHMADSRYHAITLRQILSHRSGLPYCIDYDKCDYLDYQHPESDVGALDRHVHDATTVKLVNPPGEKMEYSDFGFEILGDIIARISGLSFEEYVKQHILLPLGMTHSSFLMQDIPVATMAAPHVLDPNLKVNSYFPYSRQYAPSSHLFSNLEDMERFALVQLEAGASTRSIMPPSAYKTMWTSEIATSMPSPWEKTLGLGWFLGGTPQHRLVGHAGGDIGFAAEFIMAPDDGTAIVVMVNRQYFVEEFSYQIMRWLLGTETPPAASIH